MATWWSDQVDNRSPPGRFPEQDMELDTLPEPIYIRNSDLERLRNYNLMKLEENEFGSDDEEPEEGNLDLTAPPLES